MTTVKELCARGGIFPVEPSMGIYRVATREIRDDCREDGERTMELTMTVTQDRFTPDILAALKKIDASTAYEWRIPIGDGVTAEVKILTPVGQSLTPKMVSAVIDVLNITGDHLAFTLRDEAIALAHRTHGVDGGHAEHPSLTTPANTKRSGA